MLPPSAHWKGSLRLGLIRLRSISSHGTDHTPPHAFGQNPPLHSQIPISTGTIRHKTAGRQYIVANRDPAPSFAVFREPQHLLVRTVKCPEWSIWYRDGTHMALLRNRIPHRKVGGHDERLIANISRPSVQYQHPRYDPYLIWLINSEVRPRKKANLLQICLHKSRETQLTAMVPVTPTIVQNIQRRGTSLTEPSSEAADEPFLVPSLRLPFIHSNDTDKSTAALPVAHIFEHPVLLESGLKTGDPVKRDITPSHQPMKSLASSLTPQLSQAFHKVILDLPPPSALPVINGAEVTYQDILEGLQLGLSAILDSDMDFCAKEVVGTNARRFLADIAALSELRGK